MHKNNRFCTLQGHEQVQVNQICTYRWCDMNRWCCLQCSSDNIHSHSMPNSNHIMNIEQFSNQVKQDIQKLKKKDLESKQVVDFQKLKKQVIDDQIFDEDYLKLQQLIEKVEGKNFIELNDEDINKLLNINLQFNYDLQLQLQDKEQNVKQYQHNFINKTIDFKSREYDIQKIYEKIDDKYISSSLISINEQYLVYNVEEFVHIYDLKIKKNYKTQKQKIDPQTFQFTPDSKILFVGDMKGFVYGYQIKNGFKTFYKQKINQGEITMIIIQEQYLITASSDATIIKTNFILKNQIFKLIGHFGGVISIDYDIIRDILISTSFDDTLKIWDCQNQSILMEHNLGSFSFNFIQLINNNQYILCCNQENLQKFAIDYKNKKLVETFSYRDKNDIFAFQQVNNDQNLLLVFNDYCKILNNVGKLIVRVHHNLSFECQQNYICYRSQLDNLNYIILQDRKKLHLLQVKYKN